MLSDIAAAVLSSAKLEIEMCRVQAPGASRARLRAQLLRYRLVSKGRCRHKARASVGKASAELLAVDHFRLWCTKRVNRSDLRVASCQMPMTNLSALSQREIQVAWVTHIRLKIHRLLG